ncbi:Cholecystokinin receptor [Lamellibrachia satsuma]|nr:Cholecystokinin receptor [Lamellibrachia satsuma]
MECNATNDDNRCAGVLLNESLSIEEQGPAVSPFLAVIKVCIGVTGLVGNLLVVFVMYKYRTLFRYFKTAYIINQSVLDGLTSAVLIPTSLLRSNLMSGMDSVSAELFCRIWLSQIPLWGLMTSSSYNLMAISTERYLAIAHPIWYRTSFSETKICSSIVVIWLFGITYMTSFMVPTTGVSHGRCLRSYFWPSREAARAVGVTQIFVNMIMPFVVHVLCYVRILTVLRMRVSSNGNTTNNLPTPSNMTSTIVRNPEMITLEGGTKQFLDPLRYAKRNTRVDRLPSNCDAEAATLSARVNLERSNRSTQNALHKQNEKAKKNVLKMLTYVTASYFICWIPNRIYIITYLLGSISGFGIVYQSTVILVCANCCINPIIYIAMYDAFRKALTALYRCD